MPREPMMQTLVDVIRQPSSTLDVPSLMGLLREHGGSDFHDATSASVTVVSRFLLYRDLVHSRFMDALEATIPRTIARIGKESMKRDLRDFIQSRATASPYLRDVAPEFVAFASHRWGADESVPKYVSDLAFHELMTIEIAAGLDDEASDPIEVVDLTTRFRFQRAARLVNYQYAVHRLPDDEADRSIPAKGEWQLLGYRDANFRVRFLELTPLAAAVVQWLMTGESLREAIVAACAHVGASMNDEILATISVLLDDLDERGVLVGIREANEKEGFQG